MTTAQTIDGYVAEFPPEGRERLSAMRATIREHAPDAVERISYRMPTCRRGGHLVHFAAFARHIGFDPGPTGIAAFRDALQGSKVAKGSVQFPLTERLPLALVAAIVDLRVAENRRPRARRRRA